MVCKVASDGEVLFRDHAPGWQEKKGRSVRDDGGDAWGVWWWWCYKITDALVCVCLQERSRDSHCSLSACLAFLLQLSPRRGRLSHRAGSWLSAQTSTLLTALYPGALRHADDRTHGVVQLEQGGADVVEVLGLQSLGERPVHAQRQLGS